MYIAILGRQAAISMAELERLYGEPATSWHSDVSALIETDEFDFNRLGGSQKAGRVVMQFERGNWRDMSTKIIQHYTDTWASAEHKITLGISLYGFRETPRDIQHAGIQLKKSLRAVGVSLRLVPNAEPALNTATSHHNKLGLSANKIELLIVRSAAGRIVVAESVGSQNITAIAARDQGRPKRDAFVGMLPPKLARIMVNLASSGLGTDATILDPFCGTGVILQEASLLGYRVRGSDLNEKMIDYASVNLRWLADRYSHQTFDVSLIAADARSAEWTRPIDAIVSEVYLGQPFSAPPSAAKLSEVRSNCNHIISSFLENLAPQIASGTPLCLAIPAWSDIDGRFTHLPLSHDVERLGYQPITLTHTRRDQLLYYRPGQIVGREILLLKKS